MLKVSYVTISYYFFFFLASNKDVLFLQMRFGSAVIMNPSIKAYVALSAQRDSFQFQLRS